MGACLNSATEEPEHKVLVKHGENAVKLKSYQTTRNALAKYYLQFPRINKAYRHLFNGWCEAIGKSVSSGVTESEIFNLEGPRDKGSDALSRAGILMTNDEISKALSSDMTIQKGGDTLRFKHLIIAVGEILKVDVNGLKPSNDGEKYNEVKHGFKIIQEMFAAIDEDGSGEISLEEFTEGFADLSHGDDKGIQEKRMAELDFNKDHEISYPEFCVGLSVWAGFVHEFA